MYAIATLLDPASDQIVRDLWAHFEKSCGLLGIKSAPTPHFTWASAEALQIEPVEQALREIAAEMQPFIVRTAGIGIFTGPKPVVYIHLVKDSALLALHQRVWECVKPYAMTLNGFYHPDQWVPHITLAFREPQPGRLGCAVEEIAYRSIDLEISVDHFAVLYQFEDPLRVNGDHSIGLKSRFDFMERLVMGGL